MAINLKTDPISKSFYQYLWYCSHWHGDQIFVHHGRCVIYRFGRWSDGLGAIALVIPPFSIFTAIAMMVGIGGAAKMSIEIGKGNSESSQMWFSQSMLITTLLSTITVTLALIWLDELIALMGASGNLAQLAHDYLVVLLPFLLSIPSLGYCLALCVTTPTPNWQPMPCRLVPLLILHLITYLSSR